MALFFVTKPLYAPKRTTTIRATAHNITSNILFINSPPFNSNVILRLCEACLPARQGSHWNQYRTGFFVVLRFGGLLRMTFDNFKIKNFPLPTTHFYLFIPLPISHHFSFLKLALVFPQPIARHPGLHH